LGGRIRILVSGSLISDDVALAFWARDCRRRDGLTEASPVITAGQISDNRIGTAGKTDSQR
jgi:hypothetical protein